MRRIVFIAPLALLAAACLTAGCASQSLSSDASSAAATAAAANAAASNAESTVLSARPGPSPSPQQIQQRDYWASRVQPAVRLKVMQAAQRHTNWSQKYQVEWETINLRALAIREQRNGTAPTTLPSLPTTLPALPTLPVSPLAIPSF